MSGLFGRLFGLPQTADSPELLAAIERAVQQVEPRLRQAGGYPGRYREVVAHALAHARELAAAVPGPVDVSPEHYLKDPLVHALFGSPEDIQHALCLSHAMHEYHCRVPELGEELYALMGVRRREKSAFGMEAAGDTVRREVAQTVVQFSDHTLSGPAPGEAEARELLMWTLFDGLVKHIKGRVAVRLEVKQRLEKEKDYLTAHLRHPDETRREDARHRLAGLLDQLREATAAIDLRGYGDDFDAVLGHPEDWVRLEQATLRLDNMNVKQAESGAAPAHSLVFSDLIGLDRRCWTVMLVRCHPKPIASMADRLQEANRWLSI